MKIYLDNCCLNRPFDDPSQLRVRGEAEAVLKILESVRAGEHLLIWSYILDYENQMNPVRERKEQIFLWQRQAFCDIGESAQLIESAKILRNLGFKGLDALHMACAIAGGADFFLTTDDGILRKARHSLNLVVIDPVRFIGETRHAH